MLLLQCAAQPHFPGQGRWWVQKVLWLRGRTSALTLFLLMAQVLSEDKSYLWYAAVGLLLTPAAVCCGLFALPKDTKDTVGWATNLLLGPGTKLLPPGCPTGHCHPSYTLLAGCFKPALHLAGLKECFSHVVPEREWRYWRRALKRKGTIWISQPWVGWWWGLPHRSCMGVSVV